MIKLTVLALLVAVAAASHYKCTKNGQFLPNGYDQCSYIRCDYGNEPWYDEYGNIQFVPVVMKCPYGTSIDHKRDFSCHPQEHAHPHHHHGYHPHHYCPGPCSLISDKCPGPPPPKSQPKYEPKYEPEPHHHHH